MHIVLHFHKTELCGVEPYYFLTEEEARTYIKWAFANNPALDYKDSMKIQKLERDDYDKGQRTP